MKENIKEKKELKKITYEEVCEEALLSLMDEKMSNIVPSLSNKEFIKEFKKLKNTVLKSPKSFEDKLYPLIGVYRSKSFYDESTDPRTRAQQKLMDIESNLNRRSAIDENELNYGL